MCCSVSESLRTNERIHIEGYAEKNDIFFPGITVTQRLRMEEQFKCPTVPYNCIRIIDEKRNNETPARLKTYILRMSCSERIFETIVPTQSLMGIPVTMDFQHRYYKINKMLMMMIGQWPYQTVRVRRSIVAIALFITIGHIVAEVIASMKYFDDVEILLECVSPLFFAASCITKGLCLTHNSQRMLKLLNHIRIDWQVWADDREADILHRYADQGRRMTIAYTVTIYLIGFVFMSQPVVPKIIDVFLKNGSQPGEFPIRVDYYYLDMQKYYFYVVMYSYVCGCVAILFTVAIDSMFILHIQHGCGIFAALGQKLERLGKNKKSVATHETPCDSEKRDVDFAYLVSCIVRHKNAIEYAELLEASYLWRFLLIVGLNIVMTSISGLQIVKKINHPEETVKFTVWLLSDVLHLSMESYMSQILMDHSISIRYYIHNSKWYSLSPKAQKLLPLMLMRCNTPCKLTVGRIAIMSMETFTKFLKASVSYFTLLRSM